MTSPIYTGKGGGPTPFVNAFANSTIGSFRYNTSQAGSPIPICYGTQRVTINLLEFWGFTGSAGGKGGKGGGGGAAAGKKGQQQYSVDVAMGICQGPIAFIGSIYGNGSGNRIWSNGGIAVGLGAVALNGYSGTDGQTPDSVFESQDPNQPVIGYSGTAYTTGTPMQLGSSPAMPNVSFEITGLFAGTAGSTFPNDARPDLIVTDLLANARYGAGFPAANLDAAAIADWGQYCQAAGLGMSLLLDRQQPTARWLEEVTDLTVSAVVWSGNTLRIVPYGDQPLSANGASWTPDLTWRYSLDDGDFLTWSQGGDGGSDPVLLTRSDPAQATNWLSVEYMDASNSYNAQIIAVFDQGLIDQYGLHTEPSIQAHEFTNPDIATVSAQLQLQRRAYIRNTYRFKLGWRYCLLEPMDIALITDATLGLEAAAVRITEIAEDENGELTVTAEEIPGLTP
jgi:hypothetical protein